MSRPGSCPRWPSRPGRRCPVCAPAFPAGSTWRAMMWQSVLRCQTTTAVPSGAMPTCTFVPNSAMSGSAVKSTTPGRRAGGDVEGAEGDVAVVRPPPRDGDAAARVGHDRRLPVELGEPGLRHVPRRAERSAGLDAADEEVLVALPHPADDRRGPGERGGGLGDHRGVAGSPRPPPPRRAARRRPRGARPRGRPRCAPRPASRHRRDGRRRRPRPRRRPATRPGAAERDRGRGAREGEDVVNDDKNNCATHAPTIRQVSEQRSRNPVVFAVPAPVHRTKIWTVRALPWHDRPVDDTDRAIVLSLQRNARVNFRELAAEVGLSPNATADRVRRLERRGILSGYTAIVDPAAAGRKLTALIDVRLRRARRPSASSRSSAASTSSTTPRTSPAPSTTRCASRSPTSPSSTRSSAC